MKFATEEIAEKAFEAGYEMFMELDEAPKGDFNTVLNDFDVFRAGTSIYDIWFWIREIHHRNITSCFDAVMNCLEHFLN